MSNIYYTSKITVSVGDFIINGLHTMSVGEGDYTIIIDDRLFHRRTKHFITTFKYPDGTIYIKVVKSKKNRAMMYEYRGPINLMNGQWVEL